MSGNNIDPGQRYARTFVTYSALGGEVTTVWRRLGHRDGATAAVPEWCLLSNSMTLGVKLRA